MKDKIIEKLINRAIEVKTVDLDENNVKEISLNEFIEVKGDLMEFIEDSKKIKTDFIFSDNYFYKKINDKWIKAIAIEKVVPTIKKEVPTNKDINDERIDNLVKWTHNFKDYTDNKFKKVQNEIQQLNNKISELQEVQEEFMKELKNYVDNKYENQ